jgi:hypothetical protein
MSNKYDPLAPNSTPRYFATTTVLPWDPWPGAGKREPRSMSEGSARSVSEALAYLKAKREAREDG